MPRYNYIPTSDTPITKSQLNKKVVEENRKLQANNNSLNRVAKEIEGKIKSLKSELLEKERSLSEKVAENKKLEANLKALNAKATKLKSKVSSMDTKLVEIKGDRATAEGLLAKTNKATEKLKNDILKAKAVHESIPPLKAEKESLDNEISLQKSSLQDLVDQEDMIKDRIKSVELDYSDTIKPFEAELVALKDSISKANEAHESDLGDFKAEVAIQSKRVSQINSKFNKAESKLVDIKGVIEDRIIELEDLQGAISGLKRDEVVLNRNIGDAKERYVNWKTKALDEVAKLKLKGKLDNIDKAGLREVLDAI